MYKRILSLFLVCIILVQTFSMVITLVAFQINRDFYSQVLCINKNRPELACQGKCILMQRLKSQLEVDQKKESQSFHFIFEQISQWVVFFNPNPTICIGSYDLNFRPSQFEFQDRTSSLRIKGIFQPPRA